MAADPTLFQAGLWLGAASGLLAALTVAAFIVRWGIRFRLVGVTSFTALLAISCLAFAVSYVPRVSVPGAVQVPIVYDNGGDLVVAAAPPGMAAEALAPTVEQVARNIRASGRVSPDGVVRVRLRGLENAADGSSRPKVLAEARRDLASQTITLVP
jgi:hypothetical protein